MTSETPSTGHWVVIANVKREVPHGAWGKETRSGLRQFKASAKLHIVGAYHGGCQNLLVIGQHRKTGKYIRCIIKVIAVENLRVRMIYSPSVLAHLERPNPKGAWIQTSSREEAERLMKVIPHWIEGWSRAETPPDTSAESLQRTNEHAGELRRRLDDRDPESWMSLDEVQSRLQKAGDG